MKLEHKQEASFKPQKHQLGSKCNVSNNNFSTNATLVALVWLTLALTLAPGPQLNSLLSQVHFKAQASKPTSVNQSRPQEASRIGIFIYV